MEPVDDDTQVPRLDEVDLRAVMSETAFGQVLARLVARAAADQEKYAAHGSSPACPPADPI